MAKREKCSRPNCSRAQQNRGLCRKHAPLAPSYFVPREPTVRLIEARLAQGYSHNTLARASGVSQSAISRFLATKGQRMSRENFEKILATPRESAWHVSTWRISRRLQALLAAGWSIEELARETGVSVQRITRLHPKADGVVTRRIADPIIEFYEHASAMPCRMPNVRYQRRGYVPPLAWDDIDDPAAFPREKRVIPQEGRRAATDTLVRYLRELIDLWGLEETARRMGVSSRRLQSIIYRQVATVDREFYDRVLSAHDWHVKRVQRS